MKKLQIKPNYLIIFLLLAASMLLAACGTAADSVSAAPVDALIGENTTAVVEEASIDTIQEETPLDEALLDGAAQDSEPASANQDAVEYGNGPNGNGYGQTEAGQGTHVPPTGELSEYEIQALLFMREEEKLARDVYLAMYDVWGTPIFSNIAGSEQAHMDAIGYLLEAYGLEDPIAGNPNGVFVNDELQALYDELVAQGQDSLEAATLVGGAIEEIDIIDLQDYLAAVENPSLIQVFENLLRGSINHLNGFVRNYESQTGNVYQPQVMSQEAYEELIGTTPGQGYGPGGNFEGGQNPGGRGGRSGGQGGNGGGQDGNGGGQGGNGGGQGGNGGGQGGNDGSQGGNDGSQGGNGGGRGGRSG